MLQMALLAQPIAKRKSHVLPRGPGLATNEPQLPLPPACSHASEEEAHVGNRSFRCQVPVKMCGLPAPAVIGGSELLWAVVWQ